MSLDENTLQHPKPDSDIAHDRYDLDALIAARACVAQYLPGVVLQGCARRA